MKFEEFVNEHLKDLLIRDVTLGFEPWEQNFLGPTIVFRPELGRELNAVLEFVLKKVVWIEDIKTRGQDEHWGLPIFQNGKWRGDCDDYMSSFRLILRKLGWPEKVLRRTVCFAPQNGSEPEGDYIFNHAILGVNFDKGLIFLDNRFEEARSLSALLREGYKNFSVLSVDGQWHGV